MYFLATGTIIKPAETGPYVAEENNSLSQLRTEGTVRAAFRYTGKHAVVCICESTSLADLKTEIQRLPLVSRGLMTFDYEEITEL